MQVLVRLICLVGSALGLQQAVSYQNFRASHGQGHPTYQSDGSWSQSFGGGHRSFGGGFRGLGKDLSALRVNSPFLGSGHQNFGPSTSTYGSVQTSYSPAPSPSTIGLSSPPQYTDSGPSLSPTPATSPNYELQPSYDSPPPQGNSLINNNAGPIYSDSPSPSFSPESLPPPQGFGNDRLPPYASDAVAQNYNGPIHSSNAAPPNPQYSSGPQLLENRGVSPEFRSEVQTPQASFQQGGPSTLGPLSSPNPGPDSRSLPYQDTGSFRSDATYSSYDAPRQDFGPGPSHSPGPVSNGISYNTNSPNSNYATNGRGVNLDYSQPLRSHSQDFGPNGRIANPGPSSNFEPNGRNPSGDYGQTSHPNPDYSNGRAHNSNFRPSSVGPSSDIGPNGRIPNSDFRPHGRHPTSNLGFIERGPNTNFGSVGKGPVSDYRPNGKGLSSDITPQGRRPISDFRPSGRGPNSQFGLNGRGPTSDFKTSSRGPGSNVGPENRGSSFSSEPGRPNFNDRRTPNFEAAGSNKPFGRPHQSPLDNRGPQTFSQSKPPLGLPKPSGPNSSPGGLKLFDDRKPVPGGSSKFNVDRSKDFGAKRDKPNFSGEEGGQSFEADFKSSELGGQSFEADLPDFPSDDPYFNSGEAYGSFESGGKANFGSGEAKESLEVTNTPSFDSGEKGFSDREASFDSQERSQSAETDRSDERSHGREPNRDGPNFRDGPSAGRARMAEEKKLDLLEKKPLIANADKKSFVKSDSQEDKSFVGPESRNAPSSVDKKDPGSVKDSTSLPYTSDLTVRKPFSGPTSKLFPDKKASFAIERFVPFDKPYSNLSPTKRMPYAVESRIPYEVKVPFNKPFQGNFKRLYKRQPSDEKIVSFDTGTKGIAEINVSVPSEQKNID